MAGGWRLQWLVEGLNCKAVQLTLPVNAQASMEYWGRYPTGKLGCVVDYKISFTFRSHDGGVSQLGLA